MFSFNWGEKRLIISALLNLTFRFQKYFNAEQQVLSLEICWSVFITMDKL